jgi:hypothetical protein
VNSVISTEVWVFEPSNQIPANYISEVNEKYGIKTDLFIIQASKVRFSVGIIQYTDYM